MKYPGIVLCSIAVSALFAFAGCSSTTAKPDLASTSSANLAAETKAKTSAVSKSSPSSSSLEALQRGETPASGPLKEVHFEFDRYDLRTDARETLKANAAWLKSNPSARIEIEGHCDEPLTTRRSSPPATFNPCTWDTAQPPAGLAPPVAAEPLVGAVPGAEEVPVYNVTRDP